MKKGYTLIELLIVIVIVGVLMLAFKNIFQINNKDSLYGEACINNLYGEVSNYLYSAITSKGIKSGNVTVYPSTYYIDFNTTTNAIRLGYTTTVDGPIITGQYLTLTGTVPKNFNCRSNAYVMTLSGKSLQVIINKGLSEDANLRSMILSGVGIANNTFSGEIKFLLKYPTGT
jgi:prepilin-type N-terminal cleavage/methylation domain-containing protein